MRSALRAGCAPMPSASGAACADCSAAPNPGVSHQRFVGDSLSVADHAGVEQYGDPGATLERQVAYLLDQDVRAQRQLNVLRGRIDSLEREMPQRLDVLRGEMETHAAETTAAAQAEYRDLRILGTIALGCGLVLTTWANLI